MPCAACCGTPRLSYPAKTTTTFLRLFPTALSVHYDAKAWEFVREREGALFLHNNNESEAAEHAGHAGVELGGDKDEDVVAEEGKRWRGGGGWLGRGCDGGHQQAVPLRCSHYN